MVEQEETNQNEPIVVAERPQRQRTMEDFGDLSLRMSTLQLGNLP